MLKRPPKVTASAIHTGSGTTTSLVEPPAAQLAALSHAHWASSHSFGCRVSPTQSLEERADTVAELLAPDHAHVRHPVELDHPARALKSMKAMPGIGIVAEDQQGAFIGWHFRDHVFKTVGPAQQAQPPGLRFPGIVHVDQHRHQLGA